MSKNERSPHKVFLWDAGGGSGASLSGIVAYLSRVRGIEIVLGGDLTSRLKGVGAKGDPGGMGPHTVKELAKALASTRIHNINERESFGEALPAEIRFMQRQLLRSAPSAFGFFYDGMAWMSVCQSLLRPKGELHLVFTDQIICTWDEGDLRYHARVLVAGSPSIISLSGVVLAPARPREYYMYQGAARAAGASDEEIELKMREVMGDRYVAHGDVRIPEILKGYAIQAVAYWIFGESFCEDPDCRLFNAHWQEEMIRAQFDGPYELCPRHAKLLGFAS